MGNKTLAILLAISTFALSESKYPQIDQLIEKVKTKRVGLSQEEIKKLKNPFINKQNLTKLKEKVTLQDYNIKKRKVYYRLSSIFGNRARINGKWYKIGSKIGLYHLSYIGDNYVILSKKKKKLTLYLHKKHKTIFKIWSKK